MGFLTQFITVPKADSNGLENIGKSIVVYYYRDEISVYLDKGDIEDLTEACKQIETTKTYTYLFLTVEKGSTKNKDYSV